MRRRPWFALAGLLLILLLGSLFLQVRVLPQEIMRVITRFPEVESLAIPGLVWGVLAIACFQAVVIIGLRLVALARNDKFETSAYGWVRAIVGCLVAFIGLVVLAFTALTVMGYSSPAQAELVVLGVLALIPTVVLLASPATRRPRIRNI
jgi:hypothetical protein